MQIVERQQFKEEIKKRRIFRMPENAHYLYYQEIAFGLFDFQKYLNQLKLLSKKGSSCVFVDKLHVVLGNVFNTFFFLGLFKGQL